MTERLLVAAVAALASTLLLGSVAAAPADRVYGLPSDPLGEVWRLAQFDSGEISVVGNDVSRAANFPSGVAMRRPADASQVLYDTPAALLAKAAGPVLAYSILVWFAFWTTAVAGYAAARRLGVGWVGSTLAAALFTLTPVHMLEAQLHVGLAFVFMLPVLVVLGVRVLERPSSRQGVLFGCALGVCAYITAYLFLEAIAVAAGVGAAALVRAVTVPSARAPLARAAGMALLLVAAILSPLLVVLAGHHSRLAPDVNRSLADVATFSLPLSAYLDPRDSLLGAAGLALAVAGVATRSSPAPTRLLLVLVALAGLLLSLRPEVAFFGLDLPMPSRLIHTVVPYWRVFGRVAVVVALAGALLAAIAVDRLASDRRRLLRLAAIGVAVLAIADLVERPPSPADDLGRRDRVADVVRSGTGAAAEYPLFGFDNDRFGVYLARQLRHGRPLLNGSIAGTLSADLAQAANTTRAPEAREALTRAGVTMVVVHPGSPEPRPAGFSLLSRTPDGSAVYRIERVERPTIGGVRGAYPVEPGPDGTPFQWLQKDAALRVIGERAGGATILFNAVSPIVPREVSFGGTMREIGTAPTAIRLCTRLRADGTATIPVSSVPAPNNLPGGDLRVSGLGVYRIRGEPGCG